MVGPGSCTHGTSSCRDVEEYASNLYRCWEAGRFFLDLGAEAFRQALERISVTDVFFELFDATHFDIEYRYPLSLKYLAERLSPVKV